MAKVSGAKVSEARIGGSEPISAGQGMTLSAASYVDWPAILAGAVVASAVAYILSAFGAAIGLSLVSPSEGMAIGSMGLLIAIGIWTVWVAASSFMVGGYLTGRLRHRVHDATEHESDIRDGAHGLVMWGVGVLVGALLLATGASTVARVGAEAAGAAGAAAGSAVAGATQESTAPDLDYIADLLLRPSGEQPSVAPSEPQSNTAVSGEIARLLQNPSGDEGGLNDDDRDYLSTLVAQRTGLSGDEARERVDTAISRYDAMKQEVQAAADAARQLSVAAAFVLAASLLIGGAAAWYAAQMGGQHRDEETVFALFGRRR